MSVMISLRHGAGDAELFATGRGRALWWASMPKPRPTTRGICISALLAASLCLALGAQNRHASIVSTQDIRLGLSASDSEPRLLFIERKAALSLRNRGAEPLPASVEINGTRVPLAWRHA